MTTWGSRSLTLTRFMRIAAAGLACAALTGCANLGYYWQSVSGHLQVINAARPVNDWLADPLAPDALKADRKSVV